LFSSTSALSPTPQPFSPLGARIRLLRANNVNVPGGKVQFSYNEHLYCSK
jgi:hypothetical protein